MFRRPKPQPRYLAESDLPQLLPMANSLPFSERYALSPGDRALFDENSHWLDLYAYSWVRDGESRLATATGVYCVTADGRLETYRDVERVRFLLTDQTLCVVPLHVKRGVVQPDLRDVAQVPLSAVARHGFVFGARRNYVLVLVDGFHVELGFDLEVAQGWTTLATLHHILTSRS
jgi:hypothetical protein